METNYAFNKDSSTTHIPYSDISRSVSQINETNRLVADLAPLPTATDDVIFNDLQSSFKHLY